jgi:hypothetical protein
MLGTGAFRSMTVQRPESSPERGRPEWPGSVGPARCASLVPEMAAWWGISSILRSGLAGVAEPPAGAMAGRSGTAVGRVGCLVPGRAAGTAAGRPVAERAVWPVAERAVWVPGRAAEPPAVAGGGAIGRRAPSGRWGEPAECNAATAAAREGNLPMPALGPEVVRGMSPRPLTGLRPFGEGGLDLRAAGDPATRGRCGGSLRPRAEALAAPAGRAAWAATPTVRASSSRSKATASL